MVRRTRELPTRKVIIRESARRAGGTGLTPSPKRGGRGAQPPEESEVVVGCAPRTPRSCRSPFQGHGDWPPHARSGGARGAAPGDPPRGVPRRDAARLL